VLYSPAVGSVLPQGDQVAARAGVGLVVLVLCLLECGERKVGVVELLCSVGGGWSEGLKPERAGLLGSS
jgi:hypothetical protein